MLSWCEKLVGRGSPFPQRHKWRSWGARTKAGFGPVIKDKEEAGRLQLLNLKVGQEPLFAGVGPGQVGPRGWGSQERIVTAQRPAAPIGRSAQNELATHQARKDQRSSRGAAPTPLSSLESVA